jgi:hypothetical protein
VFEVVTAVNKFDLKLATNETTKKWNHRKDGHALTENIVFNTICRFSPNRRRKRTHAVLVNYILLNKEKY